MGKTRGMVSNVENMPPERAKEALAAVVDMCLVNDKFNLTVQSEAWDTLVKHGAIEARSLVG